MSMNVSWEALRSLEESAWVNMACWIKCFEYSGRVDSESVHRQNMQTPYKKPSAGPRNHNYTMQMKYKICKL